MEGPADDSDIEEWDYPDSDQYGGVSRYVRPVAKKRAAPTEPSCSSVDLNNMLHF